MKLSVAVLLVLIADLACCDTEYYWRQYAYDEHFPEDALISGRDQNYNNLYIGQGLASNKGLYPSTIHKGREMFQVVVDGVFWEIREHVKILCTDKPSKFYWIPLNSGNLSLQTSHHMVTGGWSQEDDCNLRIGRINDPEKGDIVGNINCKNGKLAYVKDRNVKYSDTFDVLIQIEDHDHESSSEERDDRKKV